MVSGGFYYDDVCSAVKSCLSVLEGSTCNLCCFPLLLLYVQLRGALQFQWTSLVGRQICIDEGDAPPSMLSPVCLSTSFSIVSSMKDDRLKGEYALASVYFTFLGLGINVTLTGFQAIGIYHLARQAPKI